MVRAVVVGVVLVAQSCLTLYNSIDYSPPGSSLHGILQVRILEWITIPFSRGSSQPRDRTQVSCIADRFFSVRATGKIPMVRATRQKTNKETEDLNNTVQ